MTPGAAFSFQALGADGRPVDGRLDATSETEARAQLLRRGLLPIKVARRWRLDARRRRLPVADLAVGLRMLADLLSSGLPIGRALEVFREVAPARWQPALDPLREAIREGRSLAAALADSPVEFPELVIGMARAGEAGDGIADAIRRAAAHAEAAAKASSAVRAALAYPLVVASTGVLSVGVMVGVVLPRFAVILADLGQALPPLTQAMLSLATTGRTLLIPGAIVAVIVMVGVSEWQRTPNGRLRLHQALLRTPIIGDLRASAATSRVTAALAALLGSGVSIPNGLRLASRAAGDAAIDLRITRTLERIRAGDALGAALKMEAAATPLATRLIRAGEESGRLVPMLEHISAMEGERVTRAVQAGVRALEPLLILVFAGVVGLVAMALLQAVYAVRPA